MIEVVPAQLPQAAGSCSVALPGLGFNQQVPALRGQEGQELHQAPVPMVQVDPHGHRHAKADVKGRTAKTAQVGAEKRLSGAGVHDVQLGKGYGVRERAALLSPLNEHRINVTAQKVQIPPICRLLWAAFALLKAEQMSVQSHTQLLQKGKQQEFTGPALLPQHITKHTDPTLSSKVHAPPQSFLSMQFRTTSSLTFSLLN